MEPPVWLIDVVYCSGEWLFVYLTEKARARERRCEGVGVMKQKEQKLEHVQALHTIGGEWIVPKRYNSVYYMQSHVFIFSRKQKRRVPGEEIVTLKL